MMALDHFGFLFFFLFFFVAQKVEREREREFHTYKPSIPDRSIDRSIDRQGSKIHLFRRRSVVVVIGRRVHKRRIEKRETAKEKEESILCERDT